LTTETTIDEFIAEEHERLLRLRDILTGKEKPADSGEEVARLVNEADYLYLHFPDGYRGYRNDPDFLKRVRIELEYFLKVIERA
jgi:hypothetical protein